MLPAFLLSDDAMRYLSSPLWDDERCANTDPHAVPLDVEVVRGRRAIHVVNATYRRAVFNGTFLLSDQVALPLPKDGMRRIMVERSRIWRGPCRAPGRLVVPPSHGTPTMAISSSAGSRSSGKRMKVAMSPKRGVTVPETGCGKGLGESVMFILSS